MKIKFGLTVKIFFFILTSSILLFFGVAKFVGYNFKKMAIKDAKQLTDSYATKYAHLISAQLDVDFEAARTTSHIMKDYDIKNYSSQRIIYNNLLRGLLSENSLYTSVWDSWELFAIDSNWNKTYGRVSTAYYRTTDEINITVDSLNIEGDDVNSLYYQIKTTQQEVITKPYFYSYTKLKSDEILETSIVVPIFKDSTYVGIVGMDVALDKFYYFVDSIHPFKNSSAFILDNDGSFIAHPNKKLVGISIFETDSVNTKQFSILKKVNNGENFQFFLQDVNGQDSVYVTFAPIVISKTKMPWSMAIVVPLQTIYDEINQEYKIATIVGFIGFVLLFTVILVIALGISIPLKRTSKSLSKLEKGEVSDSIKIPVKTNDEIGEMAGSVNTLIDGLKSISDFATEIGKGNFSAQFSQLSENDRLGKSILEMQKSLNKANEEEKKRKLNEEHLNWASRGIAKFSEILRYNNDDFEMFVYNIMSNIVSYLDANQGGLYVINDTDDQDIYYELKAAVGFEKHKKDKIRVNLGEGYVGRCVLEKDKIFVSDVPHDYVNITSGLGKEKPESLLFIPLKLNNEVLGVIELESFNSLKNYQIEFVEKISESIASTIYNVKINLRTAELLQLSQNRAEELEQQEEEMRQNMEEMQATQEEANKREKEMVGLIDVVKETMLVAEYDLQGRVLDMNESFLNLYGLTEGQMIGKAIDASYKFEDEKKQQEYIKFWQDLQKGETKQKVQYIKSKKKESWVFETYTPIIDQQGETFKIINIAVDITEQENKKLLLAERKQKGKKSKLSAKEIEKNKTILSQEFNFEHVDLEPMKKLYNNNLSSIKNVVNVFLKTIPEHISDLQKIYEEKKWKNFGFKLVNLKAKLKYFELKELVEKLSIIENNAKIKSKRSDIPDLIKEVNELWLVAEKELTLISKL
ncbi:MAG: GAF domain-containing protein [Bacteroidales bacterium]|nr:GAF domain-containing protein [Bacteroidales bacterium]